MLQFKFIDFTEDLTAILLKYEIQDQTLIIFPHYLSRDMAIEQFQKEWKFEQVWFLTMEEIHQQALLYEQPLLQESKRLLCFYQSINTTMKEKYRLTDYFSSLSFINDFFTLFRELNEEEIEEAKIKDLLINQNYLADWQIEAWYDFLQMKKEYEHYLKKINFTDEIFTSPLNNWSFFENYEHIIFANQFYFTGKEKKMINHLALQKNVVVYYQLPEQLVDKEDLEVRSFSLEDLQIKTNETKSSLPQIYLYSAINDFSQIRKMIEILEKEDLEIIIDKDYYRHDWYRMLSPEKFHLPATIPLQNTGLYHFFQGWLNLCLSLQYVDSIKFYLIPLNHFFEYFKHQSIADFYFLHTEEDTPDRKDYPSELVAFMQKLASKKYLYFDPSRVNDFLRETDSLLIKNGILQFCHFFKIFINIKSLNQFIDLLDAPEGIPIKKIISSRTLKNSNILAVFYSRLANLYAIEELGIITDWTEIFPPVSDQPLITNLLKFFVDFLTPSIISYPNEDRGTIKLQNLLETRNSRFNKLLFLNVTEGFLPSSKKMDFLFNELQRKRIGLKTYDEIRKREKYYFFRVILASHESHIFYLEKDDENIHRSSFVEELMISDQIQPTICEDKDYACFMEPFWGITAINKQEILPLHQEKWGLQPQEAINFYHLPSNFSTDFPEPGIIRIGVNNCLTLLNDPMQWYLYDNLKYKKFLYPEKTTLNPLLLGIISHALLEQIIININYGQITGDKQISKQTTLGLLKKNLSENNFHQVFQTMMEKYYFYRFPFDTSRKYFESILFPVLQKNIWTFFHEGPLACLDEQSIIKMEVPTPEKLFLETYTYKVFLSGRIDWLILPSEQATGSSNVYIIDIKTGGIDKKQLYLYDWLMQSAMDPLQTTETVSSLIIYEVFKNKHTCFPFNEKIIYQIQSDLQKILDQCQNDGYFSVLKSKIDEISRLDRRIRDGVTDPIGSLEVANIEDKQLLIT